MREHISTDQVTEEPPPIVLPESKEPEDKTPRTPASLIPISKDSQALAPTDHAQLGRFVDVMIKAGALPKHLKNREQVISAWNFAAQLQLPPQPSLRNIAVIEGSPSLFGDLPLSLAQRHADFVFYQEFNIDDKYEQISFENKNLTAKAWGGVVKIQRKGMKEPQSFSFTIDDANRAGLIERANSKMPWHTYPQVMLIRRARIIALRAIFADALTGASIAEDFGHAPDLKDVTPSEDKASVLNAKFQREETNSLQN